MKRLADTRKMVFALVEDWFALGILETPSVGIRQRQ
jgi:hypothetical protein